MVEKKIKKVQIKVTVATRNWLLLRGKKGQSYDDVIAELLKKTTRDVE